jgi:hypothetical protein
MEYHIECSTPVISKGKKKKPHMALENTVMPLLRTPGFSSSHLVVVAPLPFTLYVN